MRGTRKNTEHDSRSPKTRMTPDALDQRLTISFRPESRPDRRSA